MKTQCCLLMAWKSFGITQYLLRPGPMWDRRKHRSPHPHIAHYQLVITILFRGYHYRYAKYIIDA